ncbi:TadE family protein [Streptomyces sp. TRM68367]|uniref:TadE family protein n=1 Tax=Streptomyces sp. TRM68367 TaxID=2758415 RepID=UPI00165ACCAB|nr:TadE/TadG family type IV pilus assembly protein [Streptomyces sp. TRM68367]MBC9731457.1 pilus assembly protein [Streptomyces sp. TRM68367]
MTRLLPRHPYDHDRDRGSAPVQMAIIFPFVILLTLAAVQGFLWAYARNVAQTAAREGVSAGRMYEAGPGDGAVKAQAALDELAGNTLTGTAVSTAGSTDERIRIRVQGSALSLLPGVDGWTVSATMSGPVERWTTAGEG